MSKNILVVGSSGLVGSNILEHLEKDDSKITLLLRRRLEDKAHLKQIITEFNNIDNLDEIQLIDEVYICLLYTSPSPRDGNVSRMPSSA